MRAGMRVRAGPVRAGPHRGITASHDGRAGTCGGGGLQTPHSAEGAAGSRRLRRGGSCGGASRPTRAHRAGKGGPSSQGAPPLCACPQHGPQACVRVPQGARPVRRAGGAALGGERWRGAAGERRSGGAEAAALRGLAGEGRGAARGAASSLPTQPPPTAPSLAPLQPRNHRCRGRERDMSGCGRGLRRGGGDDCGSAHAPARAERVKTPITLTAVLRECGSCHPVRRVPAQGEGGAIRLHERGQGSEIQIAEIEGLNFSALLNWI